MHHIGPSSLIEQLLERKVPLLAAFFVIFLLTYSFLYAIDFVPEAPEGEKQDETEHPERLAALAVYLEEERAVAAPAPVPGYARYPERIVIDALDREVAVLNPQSTSIAALDAALLDGVVRHPDSATLTEPGTVFLFGHSSYLPKVYNRNFQAFNGLQQLSWGDTIRIYSDDAEYVYTVERVYKTTATAAEVELGGSEQKLVLVTCNSFGQKDDRFVVEAKLSETRVL